jgi:hypothetical protein
VKLLDIFNSISYDEKVVLRELVASRLSGDFAMEFNGPWRAAAHSLEKRELIEWKGQSLGTHFWAITEKGLKFWEKLCAR